MPLRKRSQSRILALQALCLFDVLGDSFTDELDVFLRDTLNHTDLGWRRRPGHKVVSYARELAVGAWQHYTRCDDLLAQNVPDWSIERMQPVDRSILRLGVYELLECHDTPHQVVINEAIELAHRFGGAESPAFVNGVLDGLRRWLDSHAAPAGTPEHSTEAASSNEEP